MTQIIDTIVAIAVGVQTLGYKGFWTRVFDTFGVDNDNNLIASLKNVIL